MSHGSWFHQLDQNNELLDHRMAWEIRSVPRDAGDADSIL